MSSNLRNRKAYIKSEDEIKEIPFMDIRPGDWFMLLEADGAPVEGPIWNLARSPAYEITTPDGIKGCVEIQRSLYDATNT